ncbi:hypothetical protein [Bosea sp. R86505]|uniref:hypothetical protein n=1 Tax=Bosea sp. R86505 TaxID=3101710 RepID=UPI0036712990
MTRRFELAALGQTVADCPPLVGTLSRAINKSPSFELNDGWSEGYNVATSSGGGATVGPGRDHATVFAQTVGVFGGRQYGIAACASSINETNSVASVQVNWYSSSGLYLGTSSAIKKVGFSKTPLFSHVTAPSDASSGVLYVVPGDNKSVVNYQYVYIYELGPLVDFNHYLLFGAPARDVSWLAGGFVVILVLFYFLTKMFSERIRSGKSRIIAFCRCGYSNFSILFCSAAESLRRHANYRRSKLFYFVIVLLAMALLIFRASFFFIPYSINHRIIAELIVFFISSYVLLLAAVKARLNDDHR